jgi:branched-chain amino acid transport system ATP-binding protein
MSAQLLHVRNLSAGYGGMPMLHNVELTVREGEIVALVGSNGAGKTTLLRALSRLIASSGQVEFAGQPIGALSPEHVFHLGLVQVPEGRQLFDQMSVQDNLLVGAHGRRSKAEIRAGLDRVYTMFPHLAQRRRNRAGSMSGGEQQMCALARALMASPRLLMIDEMSLGLAPVVVDQLREILLGVRQQGITVLLVEQDVHFAFEFADRGYVLENGAIVREGSARSLADDPQIQRAYFGL